MQAKGLRFQLPGTRELDLCLPTTHMPRHILQNGVGCNKNFWLQFKTRLLKLVHTFQQTEVPSKPYQIPI